MLRKVIAVSMTLIFSVAVSAGDQIITPSPLSQDVTSNQALSFNVNYSTNNPIDNTLSGLGLRLHWNSSALTFNNLTHIFTTNLIAQGHPEQDILNFDGDAKTDKFINMSWADFSGRWPGVSLTSLYTAHFITSTHFTSNISVNFSSSSTAVGFTLRPTSATMRLSEPKTVINDNEPTLPASLIYYLMSTSLKN